MAQSPPSTKAEWSPGQGVFTFLHPTSYLPLHVLTLSFYKDNTLPLITHLILRETPGLVLLFSLFYFANEGISFQEVSACPIPIHWKSEPGFERCQAPQPTLYFHYHYDLVTFYIYFSVLRT